MPRENAESKSSQSAVYDERCQNEQKSSDDERDLLDRAGFASPNRDDDC